MDEDGLKSTLRSMREDWDRRARENARHYVATRQADWTDEEFFASGEREVADEILGDMANIAQGREPAGMRVLEIGCGAGRVTRALARVFGEVHAVDVSGEMVAQARAALAGQANARVYQNNGMDLSVVPDLPFDFAFSVIVFQHIPSRDVIASYFREVARLLRPGALFKVQVLGRPEIPKPAPGPELELAPAAGQISRPLWKRVLRPVRKLWRPDPPPERTSPFDPPDTWVGFMLTADDAQALCEQCGFELRHQRGAGQQEYWLWCFKK
jgi:cyclopropane fatty-acyl-phospholipid synthase-like methyltransferase